MRGAVGSTCVHDSPRVCCGQEKQALPSCELPNTPGSQSEVVSSDSPWELDVSSATAVVSSDVVLVEPSVPELDELDVSSGDAVTPSVE